MEHDQKHNAKKSWFSDLKSHLLMEPHTEEEFHEVLHTSMKNNVLDQDTLKMIEGVLAISKMQVRDIMIPRSQMAVLEQTQDLAAMLQTMGEASHSHFPVIGEDKDDVLGIVLVKDFINIYLSDNKQVDLQKILRPAYFVPESKRLDTLLNEFRTSHNHLAIVVDEYGGIAGLVTIEDILEEIVGDIEDEFDEPGAAEIIEIGKDHYYVFAHLELDEINEKLGCNFSDTTVDTIGGLMTRALGHIPEEGETILLQGWEIKALKADSRRILQVEIKKIDDFTEEEAL